MAIRALAKRFPALAGLSTTSAAPAMQQMGQQLRFGGSHAHHEHDPNAPTPTVFDVLVEFNVLDLNGKRVPVKGIVGQSLNKALIEANLPASYFFPNMGFYTQHIVDAHVYVPKDLWKIVPNINPTGDEADAIIRMFRDIVQEYQKDTSYFASYIKIVPELQGRTIGIGPIKPWILHTEWAFNGTHNSKATYFDKPLQAGQIWG